MTALGGVLSRCFFRLDCRAGFGRQFGANPVRETGHYDDVAESCGVWFDKLTMREDEDCREPYSATFAICIEISPAPSW
jgi:hypothetical protein